MVEYKWKLLFEYLTNKNIEGIIIKNGILD